MLVEGTGLSLRVEKGIITPERCGGEHAVPWVTDTVQEGVEGLRRAGGVGDVCGEDGDCLLYTSPSPRDRTRSRMPSSA